MKALRVAVAEDDPLSQRRLVRLLTECGCEVVAVFDNGLAAEEWLTQDPKLDALFLDIQMPGLDGMSLRASILRPDLPVVFVTAYAEYAVDSFSRGVVDFLLKPVTTRRLLQTLERVRWLLPRIAAAPESLSPAPIAGDEHRRYPAWADGGVVFLDLALTDHFEVTNQVVWAYTGQTRLRTRWTSLAEVESHFPDAGLLRINRHLLVRPQAVRGLRSSGKGNRVILQMTGGEELEASRGATPKIKSRLELLNQQTQTRAPGRPKPAFTLPTESRDPEAGGSLAGEQANRDDE